MNASKIISILSLLSLLLLPTGVRAEPERPNILWITLEDLCPDLGSFGNPFAQTPAMDALSRQSVRYTRAFATNPVCSPARSALITGMYSTALGTQRLRSEFALPKNVRPFPAYLREAGYFTTNNVKTDYNMAGERAFAVEAWDENSPTAHFRHRKPGQPFFAMFNSMLTHQSRTSVWPFEQFEEEVGRHLKPSERADPKLVPLPPYYPDTPLVRRTVARYYDCIRVIDRVFVAPLLKELQDDGLADDTIVFLYTDHGSGMPRGKRMPYDSGLRVPLMVRFPEKYQHLAPALPGQTTNQLVSFVDFGPTVLNLLGLPIPKYAHGHPFLPADAVPPRQYIFGARDRVDEAYDLSRCVRGQRYLYVRNYMPHLSWNQPEWYSDQSDMRREIATLARAGKLNRVQMHYAGPGKPREELFDTLRDPHQVKNLANEASHAGLLTELRAALNRWMDRTNDLGFLPESEVQQRVQGRPAATALASKQRYALADIRAAAELVGDEFAVQQQTKLLRDHDSGVRYWATVGLGAQKTIDAGALRALHKALEDRSPAVRIEAAAAVLQHAQHPQKRAASVLEKALRLEKSAVALRAARKIQLLGDKAATLHDVAAARLKRADSSNHYYERYTAFALRPIVEARRKNLEQNEP